MVLQGNEVVSAIALNISQAIDRGEISSITEITNLYKDTPIQGMIKPCAFIDSIFSSHTPEIRDYAIRRYIVDVRCHPKDDQTGIQTWARILANKLISCVDKIYISNQQVRTKDIEWNVTDNVLHVICSYTFRVLREGDDYPDMETLTHSERTKRR